MSERDSVYLQILQHGLLQLRDAALLGHIQYCAVEADHFHNIPSLFGETNQQRHTYYFDHERAYYLERVDRSVPHVEFTLSRYAELWTRLGELNRAKPA